VPVPANKKDTAEINHQALAKDAKYDGKYVLRTNSILDTNQVALAYKSNFAIKKRGNFLKSPLLPTP